MSNLSIKALIPIHQRQITVNTYQAEGKDIIVEGILHDDRRIDTFHFSGESRPKATVHGMVVRILVDENLTIQDVEAEVHHAPHADCIDTQNGLKRIIGIKISSGFTLKIKNLFDKGEGCSHLSNLLIAMAPAAVQGFWTNLSSKPIPKKVKEAMKLVLADNCWAWRKNGPALNLLQEQL